MTPRTKKTPTFQDELKAMKLPQLQAKAAELGISTLKKRKAQLLEEILNLHNKRTPKAAKESILPPAPSAPTAPAAPAAPSVSSAPSAPSSFPAPSEPPQTPAPATTPRTLEEIILPDPAPIQSEPAQAPHTKGRRSSSRGPRKHTKSTSASTAPVSATPKEPASLAAPTATSTPTPKEGDQTIIVNDVLLPVSGILEVIDHSAFIRTIGYLPSPFDVYVPVSIVKKYSLRRGDVLAGCIRDTKEHTEIQHNSKQRYSTLSRLDSINAVPINEYDMQEELDRPHFDKYTIVPKTPRVPTSSYIFDLFTPLYKGARVLLYGPRGCGKSSFMLDLAQHFANLAQNSTDAHTVFLALDSKPEDAQAIKNTLSAELVPVPFDRTPEEITAAAELAIERAKRLAEAGIDVYVFIDSLTRLSKAFMLISKSPRTDLSIDLPALKRIKRILASARNLQAAGSITILACADTNPESVLGNTVYSELEYLFGSTLHFSPALARRNIFWAFDIESTTAEGVQHILPKKEHSVRADFLAHLAHQDCPKHKLDIAVELAKCAAKAKDYTKFLDSVKKLSKHKESKE